MLKRIKLSVQAKYFWIAIVIVGSIGIWLPFILAIPIGETPPLTSIAINLTTYYVSIYFAGCIDLILKVVDDTLDRGRTASKILNIIGLILLSFAFVLCTVWMSLEGVILYPIIISVIGTAIALRLWWSNNSDNPIFSEQIRREGNERHGRNWPQG